MPREIFEAATLDGAGIFRAFFSIGFPLVRNAIFTVGARAVLLHLERPAHRADVHHRDELRTIQVGLLNFTGEFGVQYGPLFAAISINVFGTLAIYLFLNQRVMKGLTAGSVKG